MDAICFDERHVMRLPRLSAPLAAALFASATAVAAPVCSVQTGSCYDYINRNLQDTEYTTWTWEQARLDAQARSYQGRQGHLVTLTSAAEEQILIGNWLVDILYGQPWLGGFRAPGSDPVTGWQWVTGEAFTHTNWGVGEPNNAGGDERFLHYQSINVASVTQFDRYGWNDAPSGHRASYFIEYSAVPAPAVSGLLAIGLGALMLLRRRAH